jgi:hypothetical protein
MTQRTHCEPGDRLLPYECYFLSIDGKQSDDPL